MSPRKLSELKAVSADGSRVEVTETVARRVWTAAGGRCSICNRYLLVDEHTGQAVFIGQLAHIVGATKAKGSPRGDEPLALPDRAMAANLMLLCNDQHKVVDDGTLWKTYSFERLRELKAEHEADIRRLTGLRKRNKSTVVRLVGQIRGNAVDLSTDAVVGTLLEQQLFPDTSLHDGDDFLVDVRQLPGEQEGAAYYWQAAEAELRRRMSPLRKYIVSGSIEHISVFALARIPLLVLLGTLLDDAVPLVVNAKDRSSPTGWGWKGRDGSPVTFAVETTQGAGDPVVTFSLSAHVQPSALPPELAGRPIYDLRPAEAAPSVELLRNAADLAAFTSCWRDLLTQLERNHRGRPIAIVPAVSVTAAVNIGRALMVGAHPALNVYDLEPTTSSYAHALDVSA